MSPYSPSNHREVVRVFSYFYFFKHFHVCSPDRLHARESELERAAVTAGRADFQVKGLLVAVLPVTRSTDSQAYLDTPRWTSARYKRREEPEIWKPPYNVYRTRASKKVDSLCVCVCSR